MLLQFDLYKYLGNLSILINDYNQMCILLIKVLGSVYVNNTANLNKLLYILLSNLYDF